MPASHAIRLSIGERRICKNKLCRSSFTPKRIDQFFCSESCRSSNGETARKSLDRWRDLALTQPFLADEPWQSSLGTMRFTEDQLWNELVSIDTDLFYKGPSDAVTAEAWRGRVSEMLRVIPGIGLTDKRRNRLRARLLEVLLDLGTPAGAGLNDLFNAAWTAARLYDNDHDYVRLARVMLCLGNLYRLSGDQRKAKNILGAAYNIVEHHADRKNQIHLEVLQHALILQVRYHFSSGMRQTSPERACGLLDAITMKLESPYAHFQTAKEMVGYWGARGEIKAGQATSAMFHKLQSKFPVATKFGEPSCWRPDIERLEMLGETSEAIKLIMGPYLNGYKGDPNQRFYEILTGWNKKYALGLESQLERPQYMTPSILFLRREMSD